MVDRLKINGSLARKALADLEERGIIKRIVSHSSANIYSMFKGSYNGKWVILTQLCSTSSRWIRVDDFIVRGHEHGMKEGFRRTGIVYLESSKRQWTLIAFFENQSNTSLRRALLQA